MVGDLPPHEAFPIGGTNSVRGYDEGAVGSGRSYVVASGEVSVPLVSPFGFLAFPFWFHFLLHAVAAHPRDTFCVELMLVDRFGEVFGAGGGRGLGKSVWW